jgi:hypothetical protein
MTDLKAIKPAESADNQADKGAPKVTTEDLRATKTAELRERASENASGFSSSLKGTLKIKAAEGPQDNAQDAPVISEASLMQDEESVLLLSPANEQLPDTQMSVKQQVIYAVTILATAAWLAFCAIYAIGSDDMQMTPSALGAFLAGMFAPPAMLWMMISSMNRRS